MTKVGGCHLHIIYLYNHVLTLPYSINYIIYYVSYIFLESKSLHCMASLPIIPFFLDYIPFQLQVSERIQYPYPSKGRIRYSPKELGTVSFAWLHIYKDFTITHVCEIPFLIPKVVAEHPRRQEGAWSVVTGGYVFASGVMCRVRTTACIVNNWINCYDKSDLGSEYLNKIYTNVMLREWNGWGMRSGEDSIPWLLCCCCSNCGFWACAFSFSLIYMLFFEIK